MKIALYLDEDAQEGDLVRALRRAGIDLLTSSEAGMNGRSDEDQLGFAATCGRALYSYNSRDYFRLHTEWLSQGKTHAGLILAPQQELAIGEQLRRLLNLIAARTAEEICEQAEFIGKWK